MINIPQPLASMGIGKKAKGKLLPAF
jgi:hypothetical protein